MKVHELTLTKVPEPTLTNIYFKFPTHVLKLLLPHIVSGAHLKERDRERQTQRETERGERGRERQSEQERERGRAHR